MFDVNFLIYGIKIFFVYIFITYIFNRILNMKIKFDIKSLRGIVLLVIEATIAMCIKKFCYESFFVNLFVYITSVINLKIFYKKNLGQTMICTIVSFVIYIIISVFSVSLAFVIESIIKVRIKVLSFSIILILVTILLYMVFKIKKLKDGIDFLKVSNKNDYLNFIMLSVSCIIIYFYSLISYNNINLLNESFRYNVKSFTLFILFNLVFFCALIIIMIQHTFKFIYKQKALESAIGDYKKEIEKLNLQISDLEEEKYKISKINHEFYNRQNALIYRVNEFLDSSKYEASEDNDLINKINELSKEYANKNIENRKKFNIPKTDISDIDDMLKYMQSECLRENIEFNVQIGGNIHSLINNYIDKTKLVTMIGDHLRDAIIAIKHCTKEFKSILFILSIKDGIFELAIFDTGIEFNIGIYEKLGREAVTTHKESGGSGIGFITTFETLKDCKASFIIEELNEATEGKYTKAIKVIFDNKAEYKIKTYRKSLFDGKSKIGLFDIE